VFRHFGGLALRGIDLLGKQTLCQLSYSRSGAHGAQADLHSARVCPAINGAGGLSQARGAEDRTTRRRLSGHSDGSLPPGSPIRF